MTVSTKGKKPKWTVVTYKQIEAKRVELGLSKSAMAEALGVTNSTFHNWRRGTTVPHPTQQEQIQEILANYSESVHEAPTRSVTKASKPAKLDASGVSLSPPPSDSASRKDRRHPGTVGRRFSDVDGGSHVPTHNYSLEHPMYPASDQTDPGVAAITAAFISSQKDAPSAGSVFEFVRELRGVLREE